MSDGAQRFPFGEEEHPALIVHDKRRIDPVTGQVRHAPADAGHTPGGQGQRQEEAPQAQLQAQLAERTADLQRLQAEYANYRRRVERDRQAVRELAVVGVLTELLPVLDDIGRARAAGELTGGFRSVAESLEARLAKLGLQPFGKPGDAFDPHLHEGAVHVYSDEVDRLTCLEVVQPGYRIGDRLLRPARVIVAEPTAPFGPDAEHGGDPQS